MLMVGNERDGDPASPKRAKENKTILPAEAISVNVLKRFPLKPIGENTIRRTSPHPTANFLEED